MVIPSGEMSVALASEPGTFESSCMPVAAVHTNGRWNPLRPLAQPTTLEPSSDTAYASASCALGFKVPRSWKAPAVQRYACGGKKKPLWAQNVPTTTDPPAETSQARLCTPLGPRPSGSKLALFACAKGAAAALLKSIPPKFNERSGSRQMKKRNSQKIFFLLIFASLSLSYIEVQPSR